MEGKHVCHPEPREAMWSGVVDKNASMNTSVHRMINAGKDFCSAESLIIIRQIAHPRIMAHRIPLHPSRWRCP